MLYSSEISPTLKPLRRIKTQLLHLVGLISLLWVKPLRRIKTQSFWYVVSSPHRIQN